MESGFGKGEIMDQQPSLTPEVLVSRLGDYLIARGAITAQHLSEALALQASARQRGEARPLGQILVEMGKLSRESLDHFITEQIINLRNALVAANRNLEDRVKQRTKELEQAYKRLSELSTLKAHFVANISHELRTPMTHIKGYIDLLRTGVLGELSPEQIRAIETMYNASERLEKLIENLILFGMMERGQFTLDLTVESINEVILAASDQILAKQQNHTSPIKYDLASVNPKVKIDRPKMIWAMVELLTNACKFNRSGGMVLISSTLDNGEVKVAINDSGIGIPKEKIKEVFEPFFQMDGSSTRKYAGVGIGLALVQQIVQAHGSEVQIESEVGHGSKFSFSLPALKTGT
jgi:signal transduction histidine kinase